MKPGTFLLVLVVVALLVVLGVGLFVRSTQTAPEEQVATEVVFAIGHGFHYSMPIVMERFGLLEKYSDGELTIKVVAMKSGIITEGLISGELQFAQRSGPAILKNMDSGATVKVLTSMGRKANELWTTNPDIQTLADLPEGVTISLNNPTSVQAIGLKIALQRLGKTMEDIEPLYLAHPDAHQLMMAGEVDCHYVGAPYSSRYAGEPEKYHLVATDEEIFQVDAPGSLLYASVDYVEANPDVVASVLAAWYEAIALIDSDPEAAAMLVAGFYGDPIDTAVQDWQEANMTFDPTYGLAGLSRLSEVLNENEVIGRAYTADEILFPVGLGGR